jgi:hypothetical protein
VPFFLRIRNLWARKILLHRFPKPCTALAVDAFLSSAHNAASA